MTGMDMRQRTKGEKKYVCRQCDCTLKVGEQSKHEIIFCNPKKCFQKRDILSCKRERLHNVCDECDKCSEFNLNLICIIQSAPDGRRVDKNKENEVDIALSCRGGNYGPFGVSKAIRKPFISVDCVCRMNDPMFGKL